MLPRQLTLLAVLGTALAFAIPSAPAIAQTLAGISNQERTLIWFRISDQAVQALLPAGYTSNPVAAGAAQGGNLVVVLIDSTLEATPDGPAIPNAPSNLFAVFSMPVTDAAGQPRTMVLGGYTAEAAAAPGYYQNYQPATASLTRTESRGTGSPATVEETWQFTGADGGELTATLQWTRGVPALGRFDQIVVSATDPSLSRNYKGHQGADAIFSVPANITKGTVELTADGGILETIFDGQEALIGAVNLAWYYREIFLP